MYFKENLGIKRRVDLETLRVEAIVTEITLHLKKIFYVGLYRPHGTSDDFVLFMQYLELLLDYMLLELLLDYILDEKHHCIIFTGDFNCRSQQWWQATLKKKRVLPLMNSSKIII